MTTIDSSLTSSEYVKKQGLLCPVCQSREINAGQAEFITITGYVECFCRTCESSWIEDFEMVGYSNLVRRNKYRHIQR